MVKYYEKVMELRDEIYYEISKLIQEKGIDNIYYLDFKIGITDIVGVSINEDDKLYILFDDDIGLERVQALNYYDIGFVANVLDNLLN